MFGRASRDANPMSATDSGKSPDYVKIPNACGAPSRTSSKTSVTTTDSIKSKPGLPQKLPLKSKEDNYARVEKLSAKTLDKHNRSLLDGTTDIACGTGGVTGSYTYPSTGTHPLERPSGRMISLTQKGNNPDPQKITQRMAHASEMKDIYKLNCNERNLNRSTGRGPSDQFFLGKHVD